jgi:hypothetical protein
MQELLALNLWLPAFDLGVGYRGDCWTPSKDNPWLFMRFRHTQGYAPRQGRAWITNDPAAILSAVLQVPDARLAWMLERSAVREGERERRSFVAFCASPFFVPELIERTGGFKGPAHHEHAEADAYEHFVVKEYALDAGGSKGDRHAEREARQRERTRLWDVLHARVFELHPGVKALMEAEQERGAALDGLLELLDSSDRGRDRAQRVPPCRRQLAHNFVRLFGALTLLRAPQEGVLALWREFAATPEAAEADAHWQCLDNLAGCHHRP